MLIDPGDQSPVQVAADQMMMQRPGRARAIDIVLVSAHKLVHVRFEIDQVVKGGGGHPAHGILNQFGQGGNVVVKVDHIGQIVGRQVEMMADGRQASDHRRLPRAGRHPGGVHVPKDDALACQAVDCGAGVAKVAIAAEMVGAQCIQVEQDDVRLGHGRLLEIGDLV